MFGIFIIKLHKLNLALPLSTLLVLFYELFSLQNGKNWIFMHNTSQRHGQLIAHYLLDRYCLLTSAVLRAEIMYLPHCIECRAV